MYRIRIHGRGGQGIKMAGRMLGTALFRSDFTVQDAPKYGAERRGAPIFSTVRAARNTSCSIINERGIVHQPDLVVVADDTLLAVSSADILRGIKVDTVLLLISRETAETWHQRLNLPCRLLVLRSEDEAEDRAELPYIGATCAGAAACLLGVIDPETLAKAVEEELCSLGDAVVNSNRISASAGFKAMSKHHGVVREGITLSALDYQDPQWVDLSLDAPSIAAPDIRATANSVQVQTGLWRTQRPVIDYDQCGNCWWICSSLCPDSAIHIEDGSPRIDYEHCKGCMICLGVCPPHAIQGIPEYLAQQKDAQKATGGEGDGSKPADG